MEAILPALLIVLAVLACPIGMWLMSRFMMKGTGGGMACSMGGQKRTEVDQKAATLQEQVASTTQPAASETVAVLQARVEALEQELRRLLAARAEPDGKG